MKNLEKFRGELDKIDRDLVSILNKRFSVTKKLMIYKRKNNLPLVDKAREKKILLRYNTPFLSNIFKLIFKESRRIGGGE